MTGTSISDELAELPPTVSTPRAVWWFTPRWSRARELGKLAPSVLGFRAIGRIVGISTVLGSAICIGAMVVFPNIPAAFAWQALIAIPAGLAPLFLFFPIHLWIPEMARITEKYVTEQTGQHVWHARLTEIEQAELVVLSDEHLYLRLRVRGKLRRIGVSPNTDLRALTALLNSTFVRDRRQQFAAARLLVEQARTAEPLRTST
jgi:hypothetical protein